MKFPKIQYNLICLKKMKHLFLDSACFSRHFDDLFMSNHKVINQLFNPIF